MRGAARRIMIRLGQRSMLRWLQAVAIASLRACFAGLRALG
jgi:hypothetical protein